MQLFYKRYNFILNGTSFLQTVQLYFKPTTFLLLITEDENKGRHYFLSKPIVSLESKMESETCIPLKKDEITNEMISSISDVNKPTGAYVISQDFFNNLYYNLIRLTKDDSHLKDFAVPIIHLSKFRLMYKRVRGFIKIADKQGNTYTHRVKRENNLKIKELEERMKINKKDV